jgi:hypothetical protein
MTIVCCILLFIAVPGAVGAQPFTSDELLRWRALGLGTAIDPGHGTVQLSETSGSKGAVLLSSEAYGTDVVVKYRVMPLSAATVLVALLSYSDTEDGSHLTVPVYYDGSIGLWTRDRHGYFFAFHAAAHNGTPHIRRSPGGRLASAKNGPMRVGQWHQVEVGRRGNHLWLKIDGETVVEAKDDAAKEGGHVGFRIRGTGTGLASCLIADVVIEANK